MTARTRAQFGFRLNSTTTPGSPARRNWDTGTGTKPRLWATDPDSNNKYITTYFRHGFEVPDASIYAVLNMRFRRDDGVIVYLNGVEVHRSNLPAGPNASSTGAASNPSDGNLL